MDNCWHKWSRYQIMYEDEIVAASNDAEDCDQESPAAEASSHQMLQ